jgi:hypothetical protein
MPTGEERTALGASSPVEPIPIPITPAPPPSANQLRNGDLSHSTNTWHETVAAPGTDKVLECAHWYSHNEPATGQALDFTDARASSNNKTLKAAGHSDYDADFCDWSIPAGVARMQGTKSLDAPFPNNSVKPGFPMYMGAIIARRNNTIVAASDCRIAAMLYDNNGHDFMQSGEVFHLTGFVRGVPAGTTERRYKVLAETDRGYSFLSEELVLAATPNDASFVPGVDVFLSWDRIDGVLRYKVFRHNVVAGTFDELKEITSGNNNYGDNNHIDDDNVGAYPVATDDRVKCYVATLGSALINLAVDGVALKWDSLFLNIPVPGSLDSAASGNQVLRIALTKALDRQMADAESTAASNSIESATGAFTARDTGRLATLFDEDGNVLHGPEAITFVDATHVTFATNVATSNVDAVLFIEGGGDHGLLVDMVHIGYLERSAYAPNGDDLNRVLPSTAVPNSSSQGGVGSPGDTGDPGDGGLGGCVALDTPVTVLWGNSFITRIFQSVGRGELVKSGNLRPNTVLDIKISETDDLHIVRTKNDMELPCSPGQVLFTSFVDRCGTSVNRLKIGDNVLTCAAGIDECSPITEIRATGKRARVGTIALAPGHKYLAGWQRFSWWKRLLYRLTGRPTKCSGIYCHNRKPLEAL